MTNNWVDIHEARTWDIDFWVAKIVGLDVYHAKPGDCPVVARPVQIWSTPMIETCYDFYNSMYSLGRYLEQFQVEFRWGENGLETNATVNGAKGPVVTMLKGESLYSLYPKMACKALIAAYFKSLRMPVPEKEYRPSPKGMCFDSESEYQKWVRDQL